MLTAHQLAKAYGLTPLFENVTFSINPGDRVGLVGSNGCGKTTLLRILTGEERADDGHVTMPDGTRLGYLPQGFDLDSAVTVGELVGRANGDPAVLETELATLATALARQPAAPELQQRYDEILRRMARSQTGRSAAIIAGLGLDQVDPALPAGRLSGGQKTRLLLALVLLEDPDLLLLDEPTNHLDIGMLQWLERWLAGFEGGVLLVSHDRAFLDHTVTRILAMDPLTREVREYPGNYSDYVAARRREREQQLAAFRDQQEEIRRMKQDIARTRAQAERTEREASSIRIGGPMMKLKGYKDYQQGIAKKVARKAKSREKKLERYLDSEERVEKPRQSWTMKLDFHQTAHLGDLVLQLEDVAVGYPPASPLLRDLRLNVSAGARIVLTGENGSGKTTLLRVLAGRMAPLSGDIRRGPSVRLGYMTQEQDDLDPADTALSVVQPHFDTETAARNFLAYYLLTGDEPLKQVEFLSYGQRARLLLARLVARGCNVLLLDEPINHLDIPSREQFEEALDAFDGTVLAVVHDRYFIERFASEVWWVEDGRIRRELMEV